MREPGLSEWLAVLDLRPGATLEQIKAARRDMAQVWHPDRFAHDERLRQRAEEKLKEINTAYERLCAYVEAHPDFTGRDVPGSSDSASPPPSPAAEEPLRLEVAWWGWVLLSSVGLGIFAAVVWAVFARPAETLALQAPPAAPSSVVAEQPATPPEPPKKRKAPRCADGDARDCDAQCTRGDANACYSLALLYSSGEGVPVDQARAAALFESSCGAGLLEGCSTVGVMYLLGNGVAKDSAKARQLLKQSCDGGFTHSCAILGRLLVEGKQLPRDAVRGKQLLEDACAKKNEAACAWLRAAN